MAEKKGKVGAPMHCMLCGAVVKKALYLNKGGKRLSASFCCYEHYIKFWQGNKCFACLPLYNKEKNNDRK